MDFLNFIDDAFLQKTINYLPKLFLAILMAVVGYYVINFVHKIIDQRLVNRLSAKTAANFISNLILWIMRIGLFIAVASQLGIQTSSFVAIFGAAGLAVGLALQGSLSNFAGGVIIILLRPFKVGDLIEVQNIEGSVEGIQVFNTSLINSHNQRVYIPNSMLSNGIIKNYTRQGYRRVEISISIKDVANIEKTKEVLTKTFQNNADIFKNPEPRIVLQNATDTGATLSMWAWIKPENYSITSAAFMEKSLFNLQENGIIVTNIKLV